MLRCAEPRQYRGRAPNQEDVLFPTCPQRTRNTHNHHGSGGQGQGTVRPIRGDLSSASQPVQPRRAVAPLRQSGQQMVAGASNDRLPAMTLADPADNGDWREKYFDGVPQPPIRRAAVKAMIRIEAGNSLCPIVDDVAAAVGGDGRPWVDDRATNMSRGSGRGCGGGGNGGCRRNGVDRMSRDMSTGNTPSSSRGKRLE